MNAPADLGTHSKQCVPFIACSEETIDRVHQNHEPGFDYFSIVANPRLVSSRLACLHFFAWVGCLIYYFGLLIVLLTSYSFVLCNYSS